MYIYLSYSRCFCYLILNYYLLLKCHLEDFTLALASFIVHSRIVPHRYMYPYYLLRIEFKCLGGLRLPHGNLFIAQFMLGLLILLVHVVLRYLIFR